MRKAFFLLVAAVLLAPASLWGEDSAGNWSLGVNYGYHIPLQIFREWHDDNAKLTLNYAYITAANVAVEVEYQYASYSHGKLEGMTFVWPVDGKAYSSPEANSTLKFNTLAVNGLLYLKRGGIRLATKAWSPYLAVGAGFYRYNSSVSGLIYPGQKSEIAPGAGLDLGMHLEPFSDKRTGLGANIGLGLEAFVLDNVSLDLRGRYNFVLGQLRPMEAWGITEGIWLQFFEIGTGLKFYFE